MCTFGISVSEEIHKPFYRSILKVPSAPCLKIIILAGTENSAEKMSTKRERLFVLTLNFILLIVGAYQGGV